MTYNQTQFDVFLCHNSEDKPIVINIAEELQVENINPWLDIWHLRPGYSCFYRKIRTWSLAK